MQTGSRFLTINVPNTLTLLRICLIPVLVVVFYMPFKNHLLVAAGIFGFAAATDWVDGYLARKLGQMTAFGAFLDPVADKLMVAVALVLLVERHDTQLFTLAACVIIGREIVVSALREWMAGIGARADVAVGSSGKIKTTLQMFGIAFMVYEHALFGVDVYVLGYYLLLAAAVMTLWSMFVYLRAAWPTMMKNT